jgi:hypothetical protein
MFHLFAQLIAVLYSPFDTHSSHLKYILLHNLRWSAASYNDKCVCVMGFILCWWALLCLRGPVLYLLLMARWTLTAKKKTTVVKEFRIGESNPGLPRRITWRDIFQILAHTVFRIYLSPNIVLAHHYLIPLTLDHSQHVFIPPSDVGLVSNFWQNLSSIPSK